LNIPSKQCDDNNVMSIISTWGYWKSIY